MNSHADIQRRLPAYCGGDLEPAERQQVELHLKECPACRAGLADLQTALRLVRSTPEVEPPPWLTARIMTRIREQQAVKGSWLQRFFFPLHIKLPLEAIALLLVCVTGYYLTRTVETDLRQARQQLQEIPAQPSVQPPARGGTADPPAAPRPQAPVPPAAAPDAAAPRREKAPLQPPTNTPAATAPATYAPAPPAFRDQQGGKAESMKAAPAAESSNRALESAPETKSKSSRILERSSDAAAPAAAGRAAGASAGLLLPQALIRLNVNDSTAAPALIREELLRSGGTITDERDLPARRLKARLPAAGMQDLLKRLEHLGRIAERPAPPPAGTQLLELTVQW